LSGKASVTKRGQRASGHGRDVAQTASERLVADLFRRGLRGEMNAFHHGVGLEQKVSSGLAAIEHGAIVPRPGHDGGVGRQRASQAGDEFQFVHVECSRSILSWKISDQEVGRVKERMSHDGREQILEIFIQINQHQGKDQQRHESHHVEMHQREQAGSDPQSQTRPAQLFDGGVKKAAKKQFLHHRSEKQSLSSP
jgi:hypothetical protein